MMTKLKCGATHKCSLSQSFLRKIFESFPSSESSPNKTYSVNETNFAPNFINIVADATDDYARGGNS